MREAGKFTTVLQNNPPWTLQWDLTAGRGLRGAKFTSGRGCSLPASLQRFWGLGQGLCGFRVGQCGWWGGVRYLFVRGLLQVLAKFAFWEWGWALSYGSMKYWDFHDTSQVFGNLWLNKYIPCLLLIIKLHFTCRENKIW